MRHLDETPVRRSALTALTLYLAVTSVGQLATAEPPPRVWALERGVPDVPAAVDFYTAALGFELAAGDGTAWALLVNGEARVVVTLSDVPVASPGSSRVYPNFTVGDLAAAQRAVLAAGGHVDGEPRASAVGQAVAIRDPFGHPANLIDHPWDEKAAESAPEVFNFGLRVRSVVEAESFLTALGFAVGNRDYLPQTLVFQPQGVAQLVVHPIAERPADPLADAGALWLDAEPTALVASLDAAHRHVERASPGLDPAAATVELRGPSGLLFKVARRPPGDGAGQTGLSAGEAAATFERFKALAGEWRAQSTRGWDEVLTYEVSAGGSVVMETNTFTDAPDRTMYTFFHLDGHRLLATHYCASGNQPRLQATALADGGRTVTFTYLDGTGLPSRDHGHMDQAVFRFVDGDTFTSKWTWYAKGHEQWLEEIEHRRVGASPAAGR